LTKIPASQANGEALLDQLGRFWASEGDKLLPKLAPLLVDLRRAILEPQVAKTQDEAAALPEFVYPNSSIRSFEFVGARRVATSKSMRLRPPSLASRPPP
jgi:hypothetical protein